jgi:hypothetical protein
MPKLTHQLHRQAGKEGEQFQIRFQTSTNHHIQCPLPHPPRAEPLLNRASP